MEEMTKKGVRIQTQCLPERIEKNKVGYKVYLSNGKYIEADQVLYATGRVPNTKGLGLESVGINLRENGAIVVNEWNQSNISNIYALGDVTDRINLTPVAIAEAQALAETVFNNAPKNMDYQDIPCAVFSQPPISSVGLSEEAAREKFDEIDVYVSGFRPMKYTMTENMERGLQKLIVERSSQRVIGAHMIGVDAPEIIQGIAIAIKAKATKSDLSLIHI